MIRSINQVLKTLTSAIKNKPSDFSIVSGNQSGDLDSIVSAITYAYFDHLHNEARLTVPLLNFSRKELNSRKDVLLVLQEHKIDTMNLFFTDDLKILSEATGLILVDHNTPQGKVKKLDLDVEGIIDHHVDEGLYTDANPRIIQVAGSCSSLVFKHWYGIIDKSNIDSEVVKFLLAPLIIDTANLTSKVEDIDVQVSKVYNKYLNGFDTGVFYKDVREAKDDIEGLSLDEILYKDYKTFEFEVGSGDISKQVGISSIVKPFDWLESRFSTINATVFDFSKNEELDIMVLMTSYTDKDGKFNRQIGILGSTETNELLINLVLCSVKEYLELEPLSEFSKESRKFQVLQQKNLAASRKQVAPAIQKSLEIL